MTSLRIKSKQFFSLQSRGLAKSFEGLNSSLAQSLVEVFPHKNACKLLDFSRCLTEANVLKRFWWYLFQMTVFFYFVSLKSQCRLLAKIVISHLWTSAPYYTTQQPSFIVSKNTSDEVKLLQKSYSGRPRLAAVAYSLKYFGNDLKLVSIKVTIFAIFTILTNRWKIPRSMYLLQKQTAFEFLTKTNW